MGTRHRSYDVVIVGGGVMGSATAFYLAEAGARVALLDQGRIGGAPSASGASAAIVEALAGSPAPLAQQAQLSRRLLADLAPRLAALTGIDVEYQRLGTLRLAYSDQEVTALRSRVAPLYAELDEPTEWLDAAALRSLEPAVAERARGALYVPSSNGLYAPRYVKALAAGAAARGAAVLPGVPVTGFAVRGDRIEAVRTAEGEVPCDRVLLASGAWTGIVSRWLGRPLPIVPQRGQIMALEPLPGGPRVAHVMHGPGGYVIPKANGTACVGATHEFAGFDARVTASGTKFLADLAHRLAPGLADATVKHVWMGFRPVLDAAALPPVGRLPGLENGFVAAGHGAIGVTVSAAVGRTLAQLLLGEAPEQSLAPFDPARVAGSARPAG